MNPANFKYRSNTLYANLIVDEVYKERQYLLQAFRYIIKENFFEEKQTIYEEITSESEVKEVDSSTSQSAEEELEYF